MKLSKADYAALEDIVARLDSVYGIINDLNFLEVPYDKEKVKELIKFKDNLASSDHKLVKDFIKSAAEPIKYLEDIAKQTFSNLTDYQRFRLSRHPLRPKTSDYIRAIFDDFTELIGDKDISPDPAVIGGIVRLGNKKYMIIGQEKGILGEDAHYREGGLMKPAGYRKSQRLMEMAEQLNLPLITFIDTPGANPVKESLAGNSVAFSINNKKILAEKKEKEVEIEVNDHPHKLKIKLDELLSDVQGQEISRSIRKMGRITVPTLAIIIGEGGSGGAVGIGAADKIIMLSNSYFSVISPEGACGILKKTIVNEKGETERKKLDPSSKEDLEYASKNLRFSADDCLEFNIADEIIQEPLYGSQNNPKLVFESVKESILRNIKLLEEKDFSKRRDVIKRRLDKYQDVAKFIEGKSQKFNKKLKTWISEKPKWENCPNTLQLGCKDMHPKVLYSKYDGVCPNCDFHFTMPLEFYIENILDKNSFHEFDYNLESINAIGFEDFGKTIEEAKKEAGTGCALVSGEAKIGGKEIIAILTQNDFRGGSFGSAESEKIVRAFKKSLDYKTEGHVVPVVMFNKGGGVRVQEGPIGVSQMITSSQACSLLKEDGIPLISVLLDPTMAGILASYAGIADFVIAEKNAMIGFAGEDVIKKTIGQDISKNFRYAEEAEKRGVIDMVVSRHDLKKTLEKILKLYD